jgi:sortase A
MSAASTVVVLAPEKVEPVAGGSEEHERAPESAAPPARASVVGIAWRRGLQLFVVAVVAFLLFSLWLSGLAHARSQVGLQRRFRSELSNDRAPIGGAIPVGAPVAIIQIPRLGMYEAVVEGTRSGQLRAGPGHLVGTSLPGQPGNAVLAGRRVLYGGPFRRLGSLHPGDSIDVTTGQGHAVYRVSNVTDLASSDGSFAQYRNDNRLTLFTSGSRWTASSRLVVSAALVGQPFPAAPLRRTLDPEGLGLTGERDATAYTLVWLELLAVLALITVYAASRWPAITTWIVCAPVVAMVLWLFFENAVRLLPATL